MKINITELLTVLKQQIISYLNTKDITHLVCIYKSFLSNKLYLYKIFNLAVCKKIYFYILKLSAMINQDSALTKYIKIFKINNLRKENTRQKLYKLNELIKVIK